MTETRTPYQLNMFGGEVVAPDIISRCRAMLADWPGAREDDDYAWLLYLELYHGLPSYARAAVMQCVLGGAPRMAAVREVMQALKGMGEGC